MHLAACPNCSGYREDEFRWIIGRPLIVKGRRSQKFFIAGGCAFSNRSNRIYDTEEEAEAAWNNYRLLASAKSDRLKKMVERLDALDWRQKPRENTGA